MIDIHLICCVVCLLMFGAAFICCWIFHERVWLWMGLLIIGKIIAAYGYIPIWSRELLKFFCK